MTSLWNATYISSLLIGSASASWQHPTPYWLYNLSLFLDLFYLFISPLSSFFGPLRSFKQSAVVSYLYSHFQLPVFFEVVNIYENGWMRDHRATSTCLYTKPTWCQSNLPFYKIIQCLSCKTISFKKYLELATVSLVHVLSNKMLLFFLGTFNFNSS